MGPSINWFPVYLKWFVENKVPVLCLQLSYYIGLPSRAFPFPLPLVNVLGPQVSFRSQGLHNPYLVNQSITISLASLICSEILIWFIWPIWVISQDFSLVGGGKTVFYYGVTMLKNVFLGCQKHLPTSGRKPVCRRRGNKIQRARR